jgi:hypothetical protein
MQWRPNGKMSLSSHTQAGRLLKALTESDQLPRRIEQRINHVRSELDEWVQREYTVAELPHEVFSELYYGTADAIGMKAADMIDRISTLLSRSYPDCAPLRDLLRSLETARRAVKQMHL